VPHAPRARSPARALESTSRAARAPRAHVVTEGTNLALLLLFGSARVAGGTSKACRQAAEALDTFVGRYLLLTTVAYVGVKLVHFKLFPDIF